MDGQGQLCDICQEEGVGILGVVSADFLAGPWFPFLTLPPLPSQTDSPCREFALGCGLIQAPPALAPLSCGVS